MDVNEIDEMRKKFDDILKHMTAEAFIRTHMKLFNSLVILEDGFRKYYPAEWKKYEDTFYGDKE